jgi:flagellar basal body-associated protein FliL
MSSRHRRQAGKLKLIVLLIAGLALGAGGSFVFLSRAKATSSKQHGDAGKKKADEKAEEEKHKAEAMTYISLSSFLVNLNSLEGMHYMRVEVSLGVELPKEEKKGGHEGAKKAPTLPPGDDAIARDTIVRVLSAQAFDDLRKRGPDEALKETVMSALQESLKECKVHSVLFTSFTLQ